MTPVAPRIVNEVCLNIREAVKLSWQLSFETSSSLLQLLSSHKTELPAQFYSWQPCFRASKNELPAQFLIQQLSFTASDFFSCW